MNHQDKRDELFDLIAALINDAITSEQHQRLERFLAEDAEARQLYFDYVDVHFGLHRWQLREQEAYPLALLREQLAGCPADPAPGRRPIPLLIRYALVAAATLCVSVLVQLFVFSPESPLPAESPRTAEDSLSSPREVEVVPPQQREYVATLGRTAQCVWEQAGTPRRTGWRLLPGECRLREGVAEIRFDGGVLLVMEGPAVLEIQSANAAALIEGKVVLKSDETMEAFTLQTPASTLLDYGTEYAVSVGSSGEDVYVLDGEVRRKPKLKDAGEGKAEQLTAGQAKRYGRLPSSVGTPVDLDEGRFRWKVEDAEGLQPDPNAHLLAYESFDYPFAEIPMAVKADGGFGWAKPWIVRKDAPMTLNAAESLSRPMQASMSAGGAVDHIGTSMMHRQLATPLRLDKDAVYYYSFLFQRHAGDSTRPNAFLFVLRNPQYKEPKQRLVVGVARSNHVVFTHFEGGGARTAFPLDYGKTYFAVGKIVASRDRPDQVFLRIFRPDELVSHREPESWSIVSRPVASDLVLDRLSFHINSQSRQVFDEIRIGTTWASVADTVSE